MLLKAQEGTLLYHVILHPFLSYLKPLTYTLKKWANVLSVNETISYMKGQLIAIEAHFSYWCTEALRSVFAVLSDKHPRHSATEA
jgi:hypothetical protein